MPSVLAAIARMSMRPEPFGDRSARARRGGRLGRRHRQRLQVREREEDRVLVPLAGQALDPTAVMPGRRGAGRRPARALARRRGRRPEQIAAARARGRRRGAANTSLAPPPPPNSERPAPDARRARSAPLAGAAATAPAVNEIAARGTAPPTSSATSAANSGTAESFTQSANPSFQVYVSPLTSPRSIFVRTSASEMGPTCSPSIDQVPAAVSRGRRGRLGSARSRRRAPR